MLKLARTLPLLLVSLLTLIAGAAGRELAPRFVGQTPNTTSAPVVAFAGDRFLTVWSEHVGFAGSVVMGAFSDVSGRRISPRAFVIDVEVRDPLSSQLVGMGDGYALFSQEYDKPAKVTYIDREGRVTSTRALELPGWRFSRVAWNGNHFLTLGHTVATIQTEMVLFDRQGRVVRGREAMAGGRIVVPGENRFIVVSSNGAVTASAVTRSGVEWTTNVSGSTRSTIAWLVAAPSMDGGVLVVWSTNTSTGSELRSAIVRNDGSSTTSVVVAKESAVLTLHAVERAGSGYVLAYGTYRPNQLASFALRLNASGEPVGSPVDLALSTYERPASATSGDTLLLAHTTAPAPARTATIAIGADGQPRPREIVSINDSRQTSPVLASTRGDAVAAWTELTGDSATVRTAHVDSEGHPTAVHEIASGRLGANGLAWSGSEYLAVYRTATQLLAVRLAPDGRPADAQPIAIDALPPGAETAIAAVWSGDRWLVVWGSGATLRIATVSAGGVPSAARTLELHRPLRAGWTREIEAPALAFDGRRVLLSSSILDTPPCMMPACDPSEGEVFAALLTPDGTLLDSLNLGIDAQVRTSIATSGLDFMLLAGTRAFAIDTPHDRLRLTATRELFEWPAASDLTWDGQNYVVALRYHGLNWYIATRRLDYAARDVTGPRGTITLRPYDFASPSIVPLFRGETLIGLQEGTARDGMRAVVYRERDLAPLPAPPSPPQNVRSDVVNSYTWALIWDPSTTGDPELYAIEGLYNGRWVVMSIVPARDGRMSMRVHTAVVRVRAFNAGGLSGPGEIVGDVGAKRRSVR